MNENEVNLSTDISIATLREILKLHPQKRQDIIFALLEDMNYDEALFVKSQINELYKEVDELHNMQKKYLV